MVSERETSNVCMVIKFSTLPSPVGGGVGTCSAASGGIIFALDVASRFPTLALFFLALQQPLFEHTFLDPCFAYVRMSPSDDQCCFSLERTGHSEKALMCL